MEKRAYEKELILKGLIKIEYKGYDAKRVQEWLELNSHFNPNFRCDIVIDGIFGPKTRQCVLNFQQFYDLEIDGIVGPETWSKLTYPMKMAYNTETLQNKLGHKFTHRDAIVETAMQHLKAVPRELRNKNEGPWVRAYMGGNDGNPWAWCVGSTLQIIDQALSICNIKMTDYIPNTYSCDVLGNHAKKNKTLIRNEQLRKTPFEELKKTVLPGDIVQIVRTPTDWTHTALILEVHQSHFLTWEGNTNDEGSREGFEVCKRQRNYRTSNLDVIRLNLKKN